MVDNPIRQDTLEQEQGAMAYSGLDGDSSLISTTAPRNESQVMLCKRFGCQPRGFVSRSQGFWKAGALHAHEDVSMAPGTDPTRGGVRRRSLSNETPRRTPPFQSCQNPGGWRRSRRRRPDALALTLGLPYGQPHHRNTLPHHKDTTNLGGVRRGLSVFPGPCHGQLELELVAGLPIAPPELFRAAPAEIGLGFQLASRLPQDPHGLTLQQLRTDGLRPAYAFVGAGQSGEGRMGLRLVPIGDAVVIVAAAERQVSIAVLDQEADRTAERDRVGNVPAIGRSQVLLGLKSRSLDLYSAPREFPMPFRSSRPPDAGPSFRPGARTTRHNRCSSRNERSVFGWFRSIGRLFTEGLSPPTRSSFLTKAGSSNPIVPELRASYQSCLQ